MKTLTLFDLEDTLIKHWSDRTLVNNEYIQSFLELYDENDGVEYGIFSYALWSDENVEECKKNILPEIEETYGINFNHKHVYHVRDMCMFSSHAHRDVDEITIHEYWKFYHKNHAILDLFNHQKFIEYNTINLIDDTVDNLIIEDQNHRTLELLNPLISGNDRG